jgi:multiple sugar transport system permease protein
MINSNDKFTLTLGITMITSTRYGTRWPFLMAGACITVLPILILLILLQRYFIRGITLTGLKV